MKTKTLLFGSIPSFLQNGTNYVSKIDFNLDSPAVEIIPSKARINVADMIRFTSADKTDSRSHKYHKSSINLVNILKHEIRDGQLNFRGKRVLELNCGPGLSGAFACLKGANTVHFQDSSAETLRLKTVPNIQKTYSPSPDQSESASWRLKPDTRFYAGDFDKLHMVLSLVNSNFEFSLNKGDLNNNNGVKRKPSQAWEIGLKLNEIDSIGGYDVILISNLISSIESFENLHLLITKCLRRPYGVIYLGAKKKVVRQLRAILDEQGLFGAHLLTQLSDSEIWKFFYK